MVSSGGACMVAPGGHAWLLQGGHTWLLRGGQHDVGCSWGGMHWFAPGGEGVRGILTRIRRYASMSGRYASY